ncbi:hypothetical protein I4U23_011940 [Adineta vaga]|nr:hypothetical protein I4U23_011940 [Adineta vaga]
MTKDYMVLWLDTNRVFSNEENQEFISRLRSIVDTVKVYNQLDQCIEFLEKIKDEKVFLIMSDCFARQISSLEEQFNQLNSIYVLCNQEFKVNEIVQTYRKGRGIFTKMEQLCNELKKDIRQLINDSVSTSIIPATANMNDLKGLDPIFMYSQLLKENLFTMEYDYKQELERFLDYRRRFYKNDLIEKMTIEDLKNNYHRKTPIEWYTMESFLFRMLNQALRELNIQTIIRMTFYLRDLHEQIKQRHSVSDLSTFPHTIYRGQGMFKKDFDELLKSKDGLFCFNVFLSTSCSKDVALRFARYSQCDSAKTSILFEIKIDPPMATSFFSDIRELSQFSEEQEVLFSLSPIFRIGDIKQIEERLWQVNLTLTNEKDPLLKRLTDHMRIALGRGDVWHKLGQLMLKTGQYNDALETYKVLLENVEPNDKAENAFLHNQLGYILKQNDQLEDAFFHCQQSIKIYRTYMTETDARLSSAYSNIGGILKKLGDANSALKFYELVLKIDLSAAKPNQLEIAVDYNNIGAVHDDLGNYSEALKSYEQSLDIKLSHLPPHHPSMASTYSNIGSIHQKMGDCSTALLFYEKTLGIQRKSLPPNHPSLIVTYGKLATVYERLQRYEEAIQNAKIAVDIAGRAYGASHPEVSKRQNYYDELLKRL